MDNKEDLLAPFVDSFILAQLEQQACEDRPACSGLFGGIAMKEPGLDHRHRDKNGQISKKHGNTLVRTLRKIYGANFAPGFRDDAKLEDVLATLDDHSLSQLILDHQDNELEGKIQRHSSTT